MATVGQTRATLDDLYQTPGKAELVGGRIIPQMATGLRPNEIAGNIYSDLRTHSRSVKRGKAFTDNMGFAVAELSSGRESFSPDASFYDGPLPQDLMRFIEAAPTFAAEVRSANDYTATAEQEMSDKRDDYFEAGTKVVWDVDPLAEIIRMYRHTNPAEPVVFRRGDIADAEPAVPGWRIAVDEVFA